MTQAPPRVLALTGATGFLGGRIAAAALADGWRVRALARPGKGGAGHARLPAGVEAVAGALGDMAALARLVAGADAVIHNAGLVRARTSAAFMAINRDGATRAAAAAAAAQSAPFVLISSLAAQRPDISAYAASKAAAEASVRATLAGRPLAILRPPAIYGAFDAATKPLFDAFRRGVSPVLGRRDARFAMIYVEDAARAALAAIAAASPAGPVFEIDDGAGGHDWAAVRRAAETATGGKLISLPVPSCAIGILGRLGSTVAALGLATPFLTAGKAREMLAGDWIADPALALPGWSAEYPLHLGFQATLACYRKAIR